MPEQILRGRRILIVEDEYLLASDLCFALTDAGADVIGPAGSIEDAMTLIASEAEIDAAVLDVNLRGEMVFPVADALLDRGIPFAFTTGYDQWALPERFAKLPRFEKPFKVQQLASTLLPLVGC